jgi:hypothetical protein
MQRHGVDDDRGHCVKLLRVSFPCLPFTYYYDYYDYYDYSGFVNVVKVKGNHLCLSDSVVENPIHEVASTWS